MLNMNISGLLAHYLFAGPGFFRHEYQNIPVEFGNTSEAITLGLTFGIDEFTFFFFLPLAHMRQARLEVEFFEIAILNANHAFSANLFFAAQRLDINSKQS